MSGGPDSICLAYILKKIGCDITAAHVNFKLRINESDEDEKFVTEWCEKFQIKLFVQEFDTVAISKSSKKGIEETARQLRYVWFNQLITQYEYDYLVTGHTKNDQAELLIMNLIRGAGIEGMRGMQVMHDIPFNDKLNKAKLLRLFLYTTKDEIINYLKENELMYRTDSSNDSNQFTRNKIRNEVFPILNSINTQSTNHISQFADIMQSFGVVWEKRIHKLRKKNTIVFTNKTVIKFSKHITKLDLYYLLIPYCFNQASILDMYAHLAAKYKGQHFITDKYKAIIGNECIDIVSIKDEPFSKVEITNVPFSFQNETMQIRLRVSKNKPKGKINLACFDFAKIKLPLFLREWKSGDKMKPTGMAGKSKKIKDILTDKKISGADKKRALVLETNEEIIWCWPVNAVSEVVKCRESTKDFMVIESILL